MCYDLSLTEIRHSPSLFVVRERGGVDGGVGCLRIANVSILVYILCTMYVWHLSSQLFQSYDIGKSCSYAKERS